MENLTCRQCGAEFVRAQGEPGRPRVRCFDCSPRRIPAKQPYTSKVCTQCGVDYMGRAMSRYCSDACKWLAQRARDGIPCTVCGEPTGWLRSSGRTDVTHKKCSRHPCGTEASYSKRKCRCDDCKAAVAQSMRVYYAKRKAEGRPMGRGRKRNKNFQGTCRQCGSDFRAEQEQHFCSRACFGVSIRRVPSTELVHVGPAPEVVAPPTPTTVVTLPKWWGVITSGPCGWCGETFTAMSGAARYCSRRCTQRAAKFRSGERFMVEPRLRYAIYQRDDWTCQLCFEAVDRDADPWSDWYPSLDHIVPQSRGGSDEWDNLRLTHRWCNAIRGDGRWHSDFFKVVTEGGALRVRPDGRPTEDLARSA